MGWKLEVVKMGLYVSFPVAMFHYFNSPGNIEDDLHKARADFIEKYIGTEVWEKRNAEIREERRLQMEERERRMRENC
ncbi:Protein PET100-like protein, mitochondrial [Frankliniella fusca]|uniref:Protein PET100-like protein, mitochondrial n=1 Tax=Frankliniella fusca TaxID=407009 RepID=A0AAE1L9K0_9NEOP|nr:Protein PET100-like protein, mitochondrial [Frankliniella fusca]